MIRQHNTIDAMLVRQHSVFNALDPFDNDWQLGRRTQPVYNSPIDIGIDIRIHRRCNTFTLWCLNDRLQALFDLIIVSCMLLVSHLDSSPPRPTSIAHLFRDFLSPASQQSTISP